VFARPWTNLANLLTEPFRRYDEAEAAYRKAIELDPAYAAPWANLGHLLEDRFERFEEAEAAYRKAIELDPMDTAPRAALGLLMEYRFERLEEAEAAYREAFKFDPGNALPWVRLGDLLADQPKRYDEAEAAYRKAIELDPTDTVPWAKLGILLEDLLERYDEAADAYTNSLELDPENGIARWRLDSLRSRKVMASIASAAEASDWSAVREQLSARVAVTDQGSRSWLVGKSFVENIVRSALRRGHGPQLLAILRDVGFDRIAAPLLLALDASIEGGIEKLSTVEPEVRSAALRIFERLQSTDATLP
jgi:tetratricopeptide (TPR) repeat protein